MYIPKVNLATDKTEIIEFMKRFSFATIITSKNNFPTATHLPFVVSTKDNRIVLTYDLIKESTKHFMGDLRNIEQMRQFYLVYSKPQTLSADFKNISQTSSAKSTNAISETPSRNFDLSWSHYLKLMRIDDENERKFYEIETEKNNWSVRELQRQFDSALYTRFVYKQKQRQGNRTHGNGFTVVARQKRIKTINKRTGKTALKPYKFANRPSQY